MPQLSTVAQSFKYRSLSGLPAQKHKEAQNAKKGTERQRSAQDSHR